MILDTPGHPARRAARRRPALTGASIAYLLGVLAVWLAMRTFGDRHWLGTVLLLSPRWVFAGPLVVLWAWTLAARARIAALILGMATIFLLWLDLGLVVSMPHAGERTGNLRLLTCNIHRQNLDAQRMLDYLEEVKPDVVALQGWSEIHKNSLFQSGWDVSRLGELLLASRLPIISAVPIPFEEDPSIPLGEQGAAAIFELQSTRGPVHLINLHFASPHAGLNSMWSDLGAKLEANIRRRAQEWSLVEQMADTRPGTLLVVGDFNTVPESPLFREHFSGLVDAFGARGFGLGYTYVVHTTQLRIDHILGVDSVQFERCWVGPDVHAAHRPLIADIALP